MAVQYNQTDATKNRGEWRKKALNGELSIINTSLIDEIETEQPIKTSICKANLQFIEAVFNNLNIYPIIELIAENVNPWH